MRLVTLEADLQNLAVVADEPSGFRIRKGDRPVTAHLWQYEPGLSFVGSPGGRTGVGVRLGLGRDDEGSIMLVAEVVLIVPIFVVFKSAHIGETEDRPWNGRLGGQPRNTGHYYWNWRMLLPPKEPMNRSLARASDALSYGGLCRSSSIRITPMATNTAAAMRSPYSHPSPPSPTKASALESGRPGRASSPACGGSGQQADFSAIFFYDISR